MPLQVWECEFCDQGFDTLDEAERHEDWCGDGLNEDDDFCDCCDFDDYDEEELF